MGEVKRPGRWIWKSGQSQLCKGGGREGGQLYLWGERQFSVRLARSLKPHLQHPRCFQAELCLQDRYKCKLSWQSCSAMYLKHLLHISCYLQVHESAKMQNLFSVSLEDRTYSWQGGAGSIWEV